MFIEIQRSNVLATDALYGIYRSHVQMIENAVLACNNVMIRYLLRSNMKFRRLRMIENLL